MAPLKVVGMGTLRQERLCGAELVMVVTQSPLTNEPYEHLVVQRCADGHIQRVQGVLVRFPEVWADSDHMDLGEWTDGPHGL